MDLNGIYFPRSSEFETDDFGDTTSHLNSIGLGKGRDFQFISTQDDPGSFTSKPSDDGCRLVLGLGPTPMAYCDNRQTNLSSSSLLLRLPHDNDSNLKSRLFRETGRFFESIHFSSTQTSAGQPVPVVDEGSTSAKNSSGYMPSLLLFPRMETKQIPPHMSQISDLATKSYCKQSNLFSEPSNMGYTTITVSGPSAMTSENNRPRNTQRCRFLGCTKGARGASGLCVGHGGGQRCRKPGCNKGAESHTAYCKAHGGGRRCQLLGCTKSAEGKTDFCIAHGGGPRCGYPGGCTKAARGKSGLCIRHGGGKRCNVEGCTRSAEGQAGLCISHGGGRRCQFTGCTKGAQGNTMFCKAHGGGKRCIFAGCTKGAEGSTPLCKAHGGGKRCMFDGGGICPKSVHGGTNFCVAHGGGKRCSVPGCTKSARGRTDCCVRHGGGKRCKVENCGKSAQGSTDFCKAHGGGKRCSWGDGKCEKFARGRSGLCAAHNNMAQESKHKQQGLIARGLFHGLVSTASSVGASGSDSKNLPSGVSVISDCGDSAGTSAKQQQLIPPDVLVPLSMKSVSASYSGSKTAQEQGEECRDNLGFMVPEGRVHGGSLMSLLGVGGSLNNDAMGGI